MERHKRAGTDRGSPLSASDARVHQASGMVSVQANCTFAEAIDLMQQRANKTAQTLHDIASAVLARDSRFDQ
jgi:AmiR/NasT family two-component response regulator